MNISTFCVLISISTVFSLLQNVTLQGTFMTFSGYLEERIGVRFTILTGASIMTAGVYFTYFAIQFSVFLTVITYGFMFGLGTALSYAPPMGVAMRWFPRHKGLVNGVIVGGFGLGAFVFNQIQSSYLNPSNKALDPDGYFSDEAILNRVPSVFLLLGSIYGVIQVSELYTRIILYLQKKLQQHADNKSALINLKYLLMERKLELLAFLFQDRSNR